MAAPSALAPRRTRFAALSAVAAAAVLGAAAFASARGDRRGATASFAAVSSTAAKTFVEHRYTDSHAKAGEHGHVDGIDDVVLGGVDVVAYFFSLAAGAAPVYGSSAYASSLTSVDASDGNSFQSVFWFASKANLEAFEASPSKYAPRFGGFCSYGMSSEFAKGGDAPMATANATAGWPWAKDYVGPPANQSVWAVRDGKLYLAFLRAVMDAFLDDFDALSAKLAGIESPRALDDACRSALNASCGDDRGDNPVADFSCSECLTTHAAFLTESCPAADDGTLPAKVDRAYCWTIRSILRAKTNYERIGVDEDAPMDTIKAEYRDQALALHGDKGGGSQQKEEAMALLNDAKATLLDPDARAAYDRGLREKREPRFARVGKRVVREFIDENTGELAPFVGRVDSYDGEDFFRVVYDDGDAEHLDLDEVDAILAPDDDAPPATAAKKPAAAQKKKPAAAQKKPAMKKPAAAKTCKPAAKAPPKTPRAKKATKASKAEPAAPPRKRGRDDAEAEPAAPPRKRRRDGAAAPPGFLASCLGAMRSYWRRVV
ncbi:hypothetical protein JL720_8587 [Aureococcus anophagefferens]|nr:hypothetical protein JL720_8587 [Aureococcus anophagefferens]